MFIGRETELSFLEEKYSHQRLRALQRTGIPVATGAARNAALQFHH